MGPILLRIGKDVDPFRIWRGSCRVEYIIGIHPQGKREVVGVTFRRNIVDVGTPCGDL